MDSTTALETLVGALVKTGHDLFEVIESTTAVGKRRQFRTNLLCVLELANIMNVDLIQVFRLQGISWDSYVGDVLLLPGGCVLYTNASHEWWIRSCEASPYGLVLYQRFEV